VTLTEEELRSLYAERYFNGAEYADYLADRDTIEKQFRIRLRQLLKFVPERRRAALFEIGCAYGFFLNVARSTFGNVSGIDISEPATHWARTELNLPVLTGDFSNHSFTNTPDVVCMWDTIEHLARPDLYLERLAGVMKPGAILAITTGDIGSTVAKLRGKRWRQIHPPTHLHYFSKHTLATLLASYGFNIRYSGSDGMYRSLDTMAYIVLKQKHSLHWLYSILKRTGVLEYDAYLNLGDIMFVVAEKRGG
jgi:2-polyprenyl-3-methyl-5-hydroxy-6-metoxy-1,4-benzoquinol methylase